MDEGFDELGKALFYTMLNTVDEAIHVVNRDGVTVFYNHASADLDLLDPREVIGRPILEVYPSLTAETSTLLRAVRTGRPILNQQQTYVTKKGGVVTTISSTLPLTSGTEIVGAVEVSKNVTRIKELSEKLIDLQLQLSQRKGKPPTAASGQSALYTFQDIVGRHPAIAGVKSLGMRAARSNSTVLVYGDTGTGKELLVQAIHNASQRAAMPFIAQNCAALPESLVEGLLFGTIRGAFTGAEDRPGLFELADGGTLYLDEINSLALDLQAKLLRVLQDGKVRRVGDTRVRPVDVRVIASTNMRPEDALAQRKLRADLYYRLNVVYIEIPPLRQRREDISLLVQHFIGKCNDKVGSRIVGVSPEVLEIFMTYEWPGNVRELEHAIEGAAVATEEGLITPCDLPVYLQSAAPKAPASRVTLNLDRTTPVREMLREAEERVIRAAVEECGGNISRAARSLGIPRQTLQRKLKAFPARKTGMPEAGQ
ncbi:MAG: sigma-54 interaction domain-containing protein [Ignavibacteriales bacterium]